MGIVALEGSQGFVIVVPKNQSSEHPSEENLTCAVGANDVQINGKHCTKRYKHPWSPRRRLRATAVLRRVQVSLHFVNVSFSFVSQHYSKSVDS